MGAFGAGLGLATDALLRGRRVVYRRDAVALELAPLMDTGLAFGVNLTFHTP